MNRGTKYTLECCVDSTESAINAKKGGADRLELCSNLIIGGTTPSLALYKQIREYVDIPIHVLIRPRFGDFLYTFHELKIILKEINMFRETGADGIVIGCLDADGNINLNQMKELIACAGNMSVTMHRAFDMCNDPLKALEDAKLLGVHTILTSGQQSTCLEGINLLRELQKQAGNDITIMAGSGVNEATIRAFIEGTGITAFHMSGKKILESEMQFRNPNVSMGLPGMSEYQIWQTDPSEISTARNLLDSR